MTNGAAKKQPLINELNTNNWDIADCIGCCPSSTICEVEKWFLNGFINQEWKEPWMNVIFIVIQISRENAAFNGCY